MGGVCGLEGGVTGYRFSCPLVPTYTSKTHAQIERKYLLDKPLLTHMTVSAEASEALLLMSKAGQANEKRTRQKDSQSKDCKLPAKPAVK